MQDKRLTSEEQPASAERREVAVHGRAQLLTTDPDFGAEGKDRADADEPWICRGLD